MTNSGDVKQVEKDIIRSLLDSEGDKVNVADFKKKVQAELLPLKIKDGDIFKEKARIDKELNETFTLNYRDKLTELRKTKNENDPEIIKLKKEWKEYSDRRQELRDRYEELPRSNSKYERITLPSETR